MNWKLIGKSLTHADMRNRILAVLGMLVVFRLLEHIPVPLNDPTTLKQLLENLYNQAQNSQLLGFLNVLSGGALANFSILLIGLGPYINASIIMQLLTKAIPQLEAMQKEGEFGRKKINQYTRIITFPLAIIQAIGSIYLIRQTAQSVGGMGDIMANAGISQWVLMVTALTGGAMVLMWLGELITEKAIGNGISLLITVGIISRLPTFIAEIIGITKWSDSLPSTDKLTIFGHSYSRHGAILFSIIVFAVLLITWAVVKLNEASRRIVVHYAKRTQGNRVYGGVTTILPVKLITAGVIPIIFAVAILSVPSFVGQLLTHGQGANLLNAHTTMEKLGVSMTQLFQNPSIQTFAQGGWKPWVYPITYFVLVFVFTYFYTSVTFNSKEIAENLQKQGGFIEGVRGGKTTEKHLSRLVNRLTLFGASALGILAVLPILAQVYVNQNIALGGTSILILVSVALETLRQIESRALMVTYDEYDQPDMFNGTSAQKTSRSIKQYVSKVKKSVKR